MRHPSALLLSIYGLYLLAVITPGANTFVVMRLALAGSRAHAGRAVLGILTGNAVWLCVTLGGVALLLQQVPGGLRTVRWAGGVYLLYVGLRGLWPSRRVPSRTEAEPAVPRRPYSSGLITSLWNPNTLPFYLSILAPAMMPEVPLWVRIAAGTGMLTLALGWYGVLAWGLSSGRIREHYARREPLVRTALSCVLLAYGVRMLVSG